MLTDIHRHVHDVAEVDMYAWTPLFHHKCSRVKKSYGFMPYIPNIWAHGQEKNSVKDHRMVYIARNNKRCEAHGKSPKNL